jgi:hypothetical protein
MTILSHSKLVNRQHFDPKNKAHIESMKIFLRTGTWGDVKFHVEPPFTDAVATVLTKYARYMLKVEVETDVEREARLAGRDLATASTTVHDLAVSNKVMNRLLENDREAA